MENQLAFPRGRRSPALPPWILLPSLFLFLPSCSREGGVTSYTTRRDSAGITIVENRGSVEDGGARWLFSQEPVLSIGAVEGGDAYQLYGVAGAHRFSDGRIGVVNAGSREIRIFSPGGQHLRTFGKRGGGPEEFEAPALAGWLGDTLIVVDRAHHRLTFVHPDQGFVGLARVSDDVGGFLNPAGTFANGESVFGGAFDMRRIGELHNGMNRAHTFYRSCRPDGSLATDFGDQAGAEFFIKDLEGSGQDARPAVIPFGRIPVATVSPDHFYFSDQEGWEIQVYSPDGTLVRLVRQEWRPTPVTEEDGRAHIERVVGQVGDPSQEPQIRDYLGGLPLPDAFPPFGNLLATLEGYLWVEDFQRPGAGARTWTIFDPEGTRSGRVTVPENFNPIEVGSDYVLGLAWDEMNVEYVRLYALTSS